MNAGRRYDARAFDSIRAVTDRPNECRTSCNAASHSTEPAARFVRRFENGFAGKRGPPERGLP